MKKTEGRKSGDTVPLSNEILAFEDLALDILGETLIKIQVKLCQMFTYRF
jgi:hypothetical protein